MCATVYMMGTDCTCVRHSMTENKIFNLKVTVVHILVDALVARFFTTLFLHLLQI